MSGQAPETVSPPKLMALRYAATCSVCRVALPAKVKAYWHRDTRTVTCVSCQTETTETSTAPSDPVPWVELDRGTAGRSAQAEYERRHHKREERIDAKFGRLAGVVKFLSDDPQSTKAWASGAAGEMRVAKELTDTLGTSAILLSDRRVPRTKGNIDHIAIAASGVWVIDAKHYTGRVEHRDRGGWFRTDWRLYVDGRDKTKLVDALDWQIAAVEEVLSDPAVPIHAVLCFVGANWGLFSKPFQQAGVWVTWVAKLADMILEPGSLGEDEVQAIAVKLARSLPTK
ncbi:MAG: nuclease-related domain-containing protein [Acidimicrobiales bacterium]